MGNQPFSRGNAEEIGPSSGWRHRIKGETSWLHSLLGDRGSLGIRRNPHHLKMPKIKNELRREGRASPFLLP